MEKSNVINSEAMYDKIRDLYKKIDHNKAKCEAQRDQIDQIAAFLTEARQNNQINANLAIVVCIEYRFIIFLLYFLWK